MDINIKNNEQIDTIITYATEYGIKVLAAIAIFIIGKWVAKKATNIFKSMLRKSKVDDMLISFGANIIYALLITFVAIAAIGQLGVETTSLAAIFAAAGLAIGFALQGSLSNFASGVMIVLFRPFKLGDFIEAAGTSGVIEDISIFTTTLKTADNKAVIIPNGSITSGAITNYSANDTRRIDFVFGIGYNDDIKHAKEVLTKILSEDSRILKDPEAKVAVLELADSSVNFAVRPWVKTADYWDVFFDITENVKTTFDKEGISIPYPQQDVHMHDVVKLEQKKAA